MRTVKGIHEAVNAPVQNLITYRALPTNSVDYIDPFLLLNHHGYQEFFPENKGLPFGPHPHRGFETVTYIMNGSLVHKDNSGSQSTINKGGIQWMTAGSGIIHSEVSTEEFKKEGGEIEILQLWINLPASLKMTKPGYTGKQEDEIPVTRPASDVLIKVISGEWNKTMGAFKSITDVHLAVVELEKDAEWSMFVRPERNIFYYVISGKVLVNGNKARKRELVEFNNDGEKVITHAKEASVLIVGHALPLNEPLVAQGPFVMNTEEEIKQAYEDFRNGKFE